MHAIVTRSTVHDFEQGRSFLQNEAIPRVRQTPGFVAAYWVRLEGDQGTAMVVFESEDAARQMAEQFRPPEGVVTIDSLEVGEVVERA